MRPLQTEPVETGTESKVSKSLQELPQPSDKIVAAVYRFRDQTGQYKPTQSSISYSTAVTQGATSILVKALQNSGWFTPIEREGISNLLNERRIIQSTRQENNDNTPLPPLLFAGVVLEGGIIGYDSNVLTGGAGVRYLGMDVSGQFRKDEVTIYLRAVSTSSGRVLKTVHTTKSILSQEVSGGVFRYVDTNKLLESEIGATFNEPAVMAVTEAIEEAVKQLIVEGVDDNLWEPADPSAFQSYKSSFLLAQKQEIENQRRNYYGLTQRPDLRRGMTFTSNFSLGSHIGSYGNEWVYSGLLAQIEHSTSGSLSLKLNYQRSHIGSESVFQQASNNVDLLVNGYLTPGFSLSPYLSVGGGVLVYDSLPRDKNGPKKLYYAAFTGGGGFDYRFNKNLGLRVGFIYRYFINDGIDGVKLGSIHDQQWSMMAGISFSPF
jgi:curli production assembly/transport component CsgG